MGIACYYPSIEDPVLAKMQSIEKIGVGSARGDQRGISLGIDEENVSACRKGAL